MYAKDKTRNVNFLLKLEDESGPYSIILLLPEAATHVFSDEDRELFKETGAELVSHDLFLGFDNRTLEWLLQHYLPHIDNIVSSFESIGHIAHMNLRGDDMLAAKYLIGAIVLEVRPFSSHSTRFRSSNLDSYTNDCLTGLTRSWYQNGRKQGWIRR